MLPEDALKEWEGLGGVIGQTRDVGGHQQIVDGVAGQARVARRERGVGAAVIPMRDLRAVRLRRPLRAAGGGSASCPGETLAANVGVAARGNKPLSPAASIAGGSPSPATPPTLPRVTSTQVASPRRSTTNSVPTTRTVTAPAWTSNVRAGLRTTA